MNNEAKHRKYEASLMEDLKDPKECAAYLTAAAEEEDYEGFLMALRDIAKAHGLISREQR